MYHDVPHVQRNLIQALQICMAWRKRCGSFAFDALEVRNGQLGCPGVLCVDGVGKERNLGVIGPKYPLIFFKIACTQAKLW
jgi:hypothetical protein